MLRMPAGAGHQTLFIQRRLRFSSKKLGMDEEPVEDVEAMYEYYLRFLHSAVLHCLTQLLLTQAEKPWPCLISSCALSLVNSR